MEILSVIAVFYVLTSLVGLVWDSFHKWWIIPLLPFAPFIYAYSERKERPWVAWTVGMLYGVLVLVIGFIFTMSQ